MVLKLSKIFLFSVLFFKCSSNEPELPYFNKADFTPEWISESDTSYQNIHTISDFSFINQNGDLISQNNIEGKIVVADFIFTYCSGICPRMTENMKLIQSSFADDKNVKLLSHSVAPDLDNVNTLKNYAERNGINSNNWYLLTGNKKAIYELARKSYFADEEIGLTKTEKDFLHTENFILVDYKKRIRGVYSGTVQLEVERLIEDIKILEKEMKAKNKI